ncbi:Putative Holliday junction resolvase YqgF [Mucinivorans hirudinis]|uniref:Putative pre-16S rRNA nuclease n=1 Tax=Mucinivorans hirudinis TaxID=1433126 RepID=A0A060RD15_9BACT|nr:Putative Holliday junction resolvase YqgF [Mucinivorans hirudinis]
MGRILAIDYGQKRVGLAVTDPLKIIATALATVTAGEALDYIIKYCAQNEVEAIVIGMPVQMNGEPSESQKHIRPFVGRLQKALPEMQIKFADERFTSKMAFQTMIDAGVKKMARRDKGTVDRISATIILQDFLGC